MAVYFVTGKLGSGKTLACVGRIRDAMIQGRRIATNLDLELDVLLHPRSTQTITRLPDKPTVVDMHAIGRGQDGIEEEWNGVIVLDELGSWLNSRAWGDKERQPFIDWLLHSRKFGWDVYFIAQGLEMVDKQVRMALVEFHVICRRWDRLAIPFVTSLFGVRPPKIHMGIVKYGTDINSLTVDRWWYRAHDLYAAYDTKQVFRDAEIIVVDNFSVAVPHVGVHTVLSPWYVKGRFLPPRLTWRDAPALALRFLYFVCARTFIKLGMLTERQAFPVRARVAQRRRADPETLAPAPVPASSPGLTLNT